MMLRFIVKNTFQDNVSGSSGTQFSTMLLDVPWLEAELRRGGYGPSGHDRYELVGVELVEEVKDGR